MYMRSADFALGVPFNIASYAFLTHMIAQVCGLKVGELIISFGDVHVYKNHITGLKEQLKRQPGRLPRLVLNPAVFDIDKFKFEDFDIRDYDPQPPIKFDVAV
jgi:thymidylate synthase